MNNKENINDEIKNDETDYVDFAQLPGISILLDDLYIVNRCEDITRLHFSDDFLGFLICPCHLNAYIMLKAEDPKLAILYLEDLLAYGMTRCHITSNYIVRALIENSEPVLDNQYALFMEYYKAKSKRDQNKPEDEKYSYLKNPNNPIEWV